MDDDQLTKADDLLRMGRTEEAAKLYCNQGTDIQKLGRTEEALNMFNRAVTSDPRHAAGWNHRGEALASMQRYEEALQSYDRALSLSPGFSEATANRLRLFQEARGNQALANALCARGALLAETMRYEGAVVHFDEALLVKPNSADAFCNRASALYHMGRLHEALRYFEIALSHDPGHAISWSNRGHTLAAMYRFDDAMESYKRALSIQHDFYDARDALAELQNRHRPRSS